MPYLPRKAKGLKRSQESLTSIAFQIGVLLAIERNRKGWSQDELAKKVGVEQIDVSAIENGDPPAKSCTDGKIDTLFSQLGLPSGSVQANFVKWWRDNG